MDRFPFLKSGAAVQDDSSFAVRFATHAVRFVDGAEQRFRVRKAGLRAWTIRLDMLTDTELAEIASFARAQQGRHGQFIFFDPWDAIDYPNCSFETDLVQAELQDVARAASIIRIRQNWS